MLMIAIMITDEKAKVESSGQMDPGTLTSWSGCLVATA